MTTRADTFGWTAGSGGNDQGYGSSNYTDSNNWINQAGGAIVPGASDIGIINDGSTALFNNGDAQTTGTLYIGDNIGTGVGLLQQTGGTLNISTYLGIAYGNAPGHSEYDISAGTLNATGGLIQLLGSAASPESAVMRISGSGVVNALGTDRTTGGASIVIGDFGGYGHLILSDNASLNTTNLAYIGSSSGTIGIMDMSGGTFAMGAGMRVGAYGGTGTLNVSAGVITQSSATTPSYVGYLSGTGTMLVQGGTITMAGELQIGGSDTSGVYTGNGYLNVSGGSVTVGLLSLARGNNYQNVESGYLNLTNGTVTSVGDVTMAFAGAGTALLNISGGTFNVGTTATKYMTVGYYDTTSSLVNISGGALNLNTGSSLKMARGGNSGGNVINQTGGTVTFFSDNATTPGGTGNLDLQLGSGVNAKDTYNLYGGTLTVPSIVSTATNGTRTFNFSGGQLRATGSTTTFMAAGVATAANVQTGGALVDANGYAITIGQAMQHDPSSGAPAIDGGLNLTSTANGGILTLTGSNSYTGQTLIASKATLQLGNGGSGNDGSINSTAGVTNAGALIFNQYGSNTAPYVISGVGPVTKIGAGTQALSGVNTYQGPTNVSVGTLALTGSGSINGSSGITVAGGAKFLQLSTTVGSVPISLSASGAILDGTGTVGATTVAVGGIVNNGNGSTGTLNLASLTFLGAATDNLNVANNLSTGLNVIGAMNFSNAGPVLLNLVANGGKFSTGTYELIRFGSSNVLTNGNVNTYFNVSTGLTGRQTGTLSVAGNYLNLTVSGSSASGYDRWSGSVNSQWDTATTNFTDAVVGGAIAFATGDSVTFDDSGSSANPVNISSGTVVPASVTFNNSTASYTIGVSGGGGIGNYTTPTTLTVNGPGTVTLASSNSYAGGTFINGGTLNASSGSALGTGPINLSGGRLLVSNAAGLGTGALNLLGGALNNSTGADLTLTTNNAINFNGNLSFGGAAGLNMGTGAVTLNVTPIITVNGTSPLTLGGVVSGANGLTLNGSSGGQLALTGASPFTGNITVNGGTYNAANGANSGTPRAATAFGNATTAGRTVTINSGGTVSLTVGNELAGGGDTTVPALTFVVNQGGVLQTAANDANVFGNVILNGGTFTSGNGPANVNYQSVILLGTVTAGTAAPSTINTNGTTYNSFMLGVSGGTTFNVSSTGSTGADLTVAAPLANANGGGAGSLIKTGQGTMTVTTPATFTGFVSARAGTLNLTGGTATTGGTANGGMYAEGGKLNLSSGVFTGSGTNAQFIIGTNYGNTIGTPNGVLTFGSGVTINKYNLFIGDNGTGAGAVYQTGGTLNLSQGSSVDNLRIGSSASGKGYYSLSAGAINTNEVDVGGSLASTVGVLEISGGTVTVGGAGYVITGRGSGTSSGTINLTGGAMTGTRLEMNWASTSGALSVVDVGGGANAASLATTGSATIGANLLDTNTTGTTSVLNLLPNGTLTTGIVQATGGANPNVHLNFNGGRLVATTTNGGANFLSGTNIDAVNVYSGGGTINNGGGSITVASPLLAPTGYGVNAASISVATANGGSGYIGAPLVSLTGGTGSGATGYAVVTNGAVSSIVITSPGIGYGASDVLSATVSGGGPTTAATITGISVSQNVGGSMRYNGTGSTTLTGANTYSGGSAISGGIVVANNATSSLGLGLTTVSTGGTLAGNGSTGGAILVSGGNVTAGSGITTADTAGKLTATASNWSSGTYISKYVAATGPGVGNDLLVMSSLSLPSTANGFTVNVQTANGSSPTIATGSFIVLAVDKDTTSANPFNSSSTAYASTFSNLLLQVNGVSNPLGYALSTQADSTSNGGFDLILTTAAAPEPTSLLLASAAIAPLALRRRRRANAVPANGR